MEGFRVLEIKKVYLKTTIGRPISCAKSLKRKKRFC